MVLEGITENQTGKNMEHKPEAELVQGFIGIIAKAGFRVTLNPKPLNFRHGSRRFCQDP